ncbi:MAG TPA: hypothetical protein VGZ25_06105 [Gemmataceae bacterium]|nr:hypothetical protein [Gemmataceae bacterium]
MAVIRERASRHDVSDGPRIVELDQEQDKDQEIGETLHLQGCTRGYGPYRTMQKG